MATLGTSFADALSTNTSIDNVISNRVSIKNASTDKENIPSDCTTIIPPSADNHTHTIIFLHGREDFGSDLAQYFFDSKASDGRSFAEILPTFRSVFPTAKLRYSTQRNFEFSTSSFADALKGEEIISQWFDVWDIQTPDHKKELMIPGLQESIREILNIIREEALLVPLDRIILGGISQGCATAILTLLSSGIDLGGFIGWCSWLPFQKEIENIPITSLNDKNKISRHIETVFQIPTDMNLKPLEDRMQFSKEFDSGAENDSTRKFTDTGNLETSPRTIFIHPQSVFKTPVFLAHSKDDEIVPFTLGGGLFQTIKTLGFNVTWKEYEDGGHWIHPKHGVDDMSTFLHKSLNIQP